MPLLESMQLAGHGFSGHSKRITLQSSVVTECVALLQAHRRQPAVGPQGVGAHPVLLQRVEDEGHAPCPRLVHSPGAGAPRRPSWQ